MADTSKLLNTEIGLSNPSTGSQSASLIDFEIGLGGYSEKSPAKLFDIEIGLGGKAFALPPRLFEVEIGLGGKVLVSPSQLFEVEIGLGGKVEKVSAKLFDIEIGKITAEGITPFTYFTKIGVKRRENNPKVFFVRIGALYYVPPLPASTKGVSTLPRRPRREVYKRVPIRKGFAQPNIPRVKTPKPIAFETSQRKLLERPKKAKEFIFKPVEGRMIPTGRKVLIVRGERLPSKVIANIKQVLSTEKEREL